jgi:hypothetical protein
LPVRAKSAASTEARLEAARQRVADVARQIEDGLETTVWPACRS